MPPSYELASGVPWFENVNAVSEDVRAPYRNISTHLLTADEAELDRFLSTHLLPEKFNVGLSAFPISYYVGLKESDELGTKVFFESVLHRPGPYLKYVARTSADSFLERERYRIFPLSQDVAPYHQTITPIDRTHFRLTFEPVSYGYNDPVIWTPGYKLFSAIYDARCRTKRFSALLCSDFRCVTPGLCPWLDLPNCGLISDDGKSAWVCGFLRDRYRVPLEGNPIGATGNRNASGSNLWISPAGGFSHGCANARRAQKSGCYVAGRIVR